MIVVAADAPHGERLASELAAEGVDAVAVSAAAPADAADAALFGETDAGPVLAGADVLVLVVTRTTLTPALLAACDRRGVRIVPLGGDAEGASAAALAGLAPPLPVDLPGWRLAEAIGAVPAVAAPVPPTSDGIVLTVWGPAGAPGRSTVAAALAVELARGDRRVVLVDADSHAPSLALALGLADEGPGFAAACRQAERGALDDAELARISTPLALADGRVHVLTGINRPSRWPELGESRVAAALAACREWADYVVVDVAASLERDEEIVSDVDGPRRNAATLAALRSADVVVSVLSADSLGASRFVRGCAELRATIGTTPLVVAANRLRPGALGIDPRGQIRRTLDRFAGVADVTFLPHDGRAADAALLSGRPLVEVAPRSALTLAVRRLGSAALATKPAAAPDPEASATRGRRRRRARRRDAVA